MRCVRCICALALLAIASPAMLRAQGHPYTEGSVWDITMIRTADGMTEDYLQSLSTTWRRVLDEAKKQGLVVSYHVISTTTSTPDDWDLLLMVEYKNWAAFDGLTAKMDPIEHSIIGTESQTRELMTKRVQIRRILGDKNGQELILK